jgi:hypothetical protein
MKSDLLFSFQRYYINLCAQNDDINERNRRSKSNSAIRSPMKRNMNLKAGIAVMLAAAIAALALPGLTGIAFAQKNASIEARLQRLEDREEIRQLIQDYGRFLDRRDFASFSGLFAEKEGEWIGGMGKAKGRQAIRKLMETSIGQNAAGPAAGPNYHLFTNEMIQANGNEAKATTKWIFVVQNSSTQPQPMYLGHYDDVLVRELGRWKFLKRQVSSDIPSDASLSKK